MEMTLKELKVAVARECTRPFLVGFRDLDVVVKVHPHDLGNVKRNVYKGAVPPGVRFEALKLQDRLKAAWSMLHV
jgi:hypothetical protein